MTTINQIRMKISCCHACRQRAVKILRDMCYGFQINLMDIDTIEEDKLEAAAYNHVNTLDEDLKAAHTVRQMDLIQ